MGERDKDLEDKKKCLRLLVAFVVSSFFSRLALARTRQSTVLVTHSKYFRLRSRQNIIWGESTEQIGMVSCFRCFRCLFRTHKSCSSALPHSDLEVILVSLARLSRWPSFLADSSRRVLQPRKFKEFARSTAIDKTSINRMSGTTVSCKIATDLLTLPVDSSSHDDSRPPVGTESVAAEIHRLERTRSVASESLPADIEAQSPTVNDGERKPLLRKNKTKDKPVRGAGATKMRRQTTNESVRLHFSCPSSFL